MLTQLAIKHKEVTHKPRPLILSLHQQLQTSGQAMVNCSRAPCPDLPCGPDEMEQVPGSCCAQCRPPRPAVPPPTAPPGMVNEGSLQTLEEQRNTIMSNGGCLRNNVRAFVVVLFVLFLSFDILFFPCEVGRAMSLSHAWSYILSYLVFSLPMTSSAHHLHVSSGLPAGLLPSVDLYVHGCSVHLLSYLLILLCHDSI